MMSKSAVLGIAGPVEAGDAKLYVDGFKIGAMATKPGLKVNVTYTGSFSDVSLMAAASPKPISRLVPMCSPVPLNPWLAPLELPKIRKRFWFGTQWDQTALAPTIVVSSQVYDWTGILKG